MLKLKILFSALRTAKSFAQKHLRNKERNQKDYFLPYYENIEKVVEKHITVIHWLNEEVNSYSYTDQEDMYSVLDEINKHNDEIFKRANNAADGATLEDMSIEISNLRIKYQGCIHDSLSVSLEQYAADCMEAHQIGEAQFLLPRCKGILELIRDFKSNIPTVHKESVIQ
ncbi:hypothetical protein [Moritella viscosa]|uniref:Putative integrase n=1 Tax=Moritella viscosa TaxID=80854 RepID=A0A1L0CQ22_9GAMM|nr:hypothetical protein [Moritella viscosa]SGZ20453.1 Putative integrase [Moritella viscosa]